MGLISSKMLTEGTSGFSSKQIQDTVARFGAHLDFKSGMDRFVVTLYSQKKYGVKMVSFLRELIYDSIFPEGDIEKIKAIELESLKVNNEKTSFIASNQFRELLFTDKHSYGRVLTEESLQRVDRTYLLSFYKEVFKPSLSEVYISGGFDQPIIDEIKGCFLTNKLESRKDIKEEVGEVRGLVKRIEKEKALQSSIRIGRSVIGRTHPEYIDMIIANEVLGGYFGSRLMKNIREEKGLTYGIYSQCATYEKGSFWAIAADVKKELVDTATSEVYKEVKLLIEDGVDDEELHVVTNYMAGSFLSSINTPYDIIDKFKLVYYGGVNYDYYKQFYDRLETITSKDIQSIASKYFTETNELIVG